MKLTFHYWEYEGTEVIEDAEKVLAPTDVFDYWTIWYFKNQDGEVRVRFIPQDRIKEVEMFGEAEEEKPLASVTPLRKVEDDVGPISQD